jgi:hypothetical protein
MLCLHLRTSECLHLRHAGVIDAGTLEAARYIAQRLLQPADRWEYKYGRYASWAAGKCSLSNGYGNARSCTCTTCMGRRSVSEANELLNASVMGYHAKSSPQMSGALRLSKQKHLFAHVRLRARLSAQCRLRRGFVSLDDHWRWVAGRTCAPSEVDNR